MSNRFRNRQVEQDVGRENCNLNKSYIVSCLHNNRQNTQNHLSEGDSTAVLPQNSIFSSYTLNTKRIQ